MSNRARALRAAYARALLPLLPPPLLVALDAARERGVEVETWTERPDEPWRRKPRRLDVHLALEGPAGSLEPLGPWLDSLRGAATRCHGVSIFWRGDARIEAYSLWLEGFRVPDLDPAAEAAFDSRADLEYLLASHAPLRSLPDGAADTLRAAVALGARGRCHDGRLELSPHAGPRHTALLRRDGFWKLPSGPLRGWFVRPLPRSNP